MNKLAYFYENHETFAKILSEEELKQKEEELLQGELADAISQLVTPVLAGVSSPVSIMIDYDPHGGVTVEVARKDLSSSSAINQQPSGFVSEASATEEPMARSYSLRSESIGFTIRFPDGTEVQRKNAKETMIATLKVIGMHKVAAFRGRLFKGYPLVSRNRRTDVDFKCQEYVDGWYVYTNMSNDIKIDVLRQISDELRLGLQITGDMSKTVTDVADVAKKGKPGQRTLYKINGDGPYCKRELVLLAVTQYMMEHSDYTYAQMEQTFPKNLQGSYGVIRPVSWIMEKSKMGADHKSRYYLSDKDILTSSDGIRFAVCNQWGDNFSNFMQQMEHLGWKVEEE